MPELASSDKTQLRRLVSSKADLCSKIKQLECPVGSYTTKSGDIIPDSAIAIYITINPRCLRKATVEGIRCLAANIGKDLDGGMKTTCLNPHSEILSVIHRAKSRSCFVDFDIDHGEGDNKSSMSLDEIKKKTIDIVGKEAPTFLVTRGGVHVLVQPKLVVSDTKNWHPIICKTLSCDQIGDLMIPIPGCNQGGFTPYLVRE